MSNATSEARVDLNAEKLLLLKLHRKFGHFNINDPDCSITFDLDNEVVRIQGPTPEKVKFNFLF